jgi:hypothetical protein
LKKPFVQEFELKSAQKQAEKLLGVINQFGYYQDQPEIVQWLMTHTNLHLNLQVQFDTQTELRQKNIAQLLSLVSNLRLSDTEACPAAISISRCLGQLQAVANARPDFTDSVMTFNLDDEYFSFSSQQWTDLITRSRVSIMLRNIILLRGRSNNGWVFFDSPSVYLDLQMNAGSDSGMLSLGKARIDGRLTAEAFNNNVKPTLMALSDIVDKLPIDAEEKRHFTDFVLNNLQTYSDRYINAWLNYFRQFQIRIDNPWTLNYVLDQIQQSNSPLQETLLQIKNNTALDMPPLPYFQSFAQRLTVFRFIQRLMQEKNGEYPEFQKYQAIMLQMQNDISSQEPYVPKKFGDDAAGLKAALTPVGRVAWPMLLNEEGSYIKLVKNWLQSAEILSAWQTPFLAPVKKVSELGTLEIQQVTDGIWQDIWNSNVLPQLDKFPFQQEAGQDRELTVDDLNKVFHPKQGAFWIGFNQYLTPLCVFGNGVWAQRQELVDKIPMPKHFLDRLNTVQQLTANLWDVQGNPKPLQFSVMPGLMPTFDTKLMPRATLVSLTYLRIGSSSILGFNQKPDWQNLSLEWWTSQATEVGMEFRKDAGTTRSYADINISDSNWNFYRLLQQGKMTMTNSYGQKNIPYVWHLSHPDYPQQLLNLEFSFKNNPWSIFAKLAGS